MEKKIILLLALSTVLAACGSGSSGSVHINTNPANPSNPNNPNTPGQSGNITPTFGPITKSIPVDHSKANNGVALVATAYETAPDTYIWRTEVEPLPSHDRNQIVVEGKTVTLIPTYMSVGNFFQTDDSLDGTYRTVSGNFLSYSRFGYAAHFDSPTAKFFSLGAITSDMPRAGTAKYAGKVVESAVHKTDEDRDYTHAGGTFTADVDFAARTVSARLSNVGEAENESRGFTARINGAEFLGTGGSGGIQGVAGKFYGPDAAEIGGVYRGETNEHLIVGGFGGTKQ